MNCNLDLSFIIASIYFNFSSARIFSVIQSCYTVYSSNLFSLLHTVHLRNKTHHKWKTTDAVHLYKMIWGLLTILTISRPACQIIPIWISFPNDLVTIHTSYLAHTYSNTMLRTLTFPDIYPCQQYTPNSYNSITINHVISFGLCTVVQLI